MEYELRELGDLKVIGYKERQSKHNNAVDNLWKYVYENGRSEMLLEKCAEDTRGLVGICSNFAEDISFDYCVGVISTCSDVIVDTIIQDIKQAKYAVFKCNRENIKDTYLEIYGGWIESVDFDFAFTHNIEFYTDTNRCEIYVPIIL